MNNQLALSAQNISFQYEQNALLLQNIYLEVNKGENILLTGASGSGKTTLLHILGKILQPTNGTIQHFGKCSFIFQANYLLSNCTALENVALALIVHGLEWNKAIQEANNMLEQVEMSHRANALPAELSGGEKQRIAVARAMITKPEIILCDEPTGNLDDARTAIVFRMLKELSRKYNSAILVVSHENKIPMTFDRHYQLNQGKLTEKSIE